VDNPWLALPERPEFVLKEDGAVLSRYPRVRNNLGLDVLPVPYMSNPARASIYLLTLNPGYHPRDLTFERCEPDYVEQRKASLVFESRWPLVSLDPAFSFSGGFDYWRSRLRGVVVALAAKDAHHDENAAWQLVAERVMVIQFFPYRSISDPDCPEVLPSQKFTFKLVQGALDSGALIVLLRAIRQWSAQVPDLDSAAVLKPAVARSGRLSSNHELAIVDRLSS
jgi:hypothetical protein